MDQNQNHKSGQLDERERELLQQRMEQIARRERFHERARTLELDEREQAEREKLIKQAKKEAREEKQTKIREYVIATVMALIVMGVLAAIILR